MKSSIRRQDSFSLWFTFLSGGGLRSSFRSQDDSSYLFRFLLFDVGVVWRPESGMKTDRFIFFTFLPGGSHLVRVPALHLKTAHFTILLFLPFLLGGLRFGFRHLNGSFYLFLSLPCGGLRSSLKSKDRSIYLLPFYLSTLRGGRGEGSGISHQNGSF